MTTQTHIDAIRAAEEEAATIVEKAHKDAQEKIAQARTEAQEMEASYAKSVEAAQSKRLVSQKQQLIEVATKMHVDAEAQAAKIMEDAAHKRTKAVADAVAALSA